MRGNQLLNSSGGAGFESFNIVNYVGNGTSQDIDAGIEAGLIYIKPRDTGGNWVIASTALGVNRVHYFDNSVWNLASNNVTSFNPNGFSVGSNTLVNNSGVTYVAYCWKLGGNSDAINIDGVGYPDLASAGLTSANGIAKISANRLNGASAVQYYGGGGGNFATGMDVYPRAAHIKYLIGGQDYIWNMKDYSETRGVNIQDASSPNPTNYTSIYTSSSATNFGIASSLNLSSRIYMGYTFAPKAGYSAMGKYFSGSPSGTPVTVGLGFKPDMLILILSTSPSQKFVFDSLNSGGTKSFSLGSTSSMSQYDNTTVDITDTGFTVGGNGYRSPNYPTDYRVEYYAWTIK